MPDHDELALRLRSAYQHGAVPSLREALAPEDADSAYEIQFANTRHWLQSGRRIIGRKIGLTSKAVQMQLGVNQPDFGVLFDDMRIADGGALDPGRTLQPKAEAEIALLLDKDLTSPDTTMEMVAAAVRSVHAAIEIVDSRIADWNITFADTVADNGSSAFFVMADEGRPLAGLDLYTCGMVLEIDGQIASLGAGAACLGHPLKAAAWLASTLARAGEPLKAGDILLTGALGPMAPLVPGNHVKTVIGGVGACAFTFGKA